MAIDDKPTDLMAARLSKGEDLDLIYTNPKNHIVCFIPTYQPSGGDSTKCYFVDGREEMVHLPMRTITRELAMQEDDFIRNIHITHLSIANDYARAGDAGRAEAQLHHDQRWSTQQLYRA